MNLLPPPDQLERWTAEENERRCPIGLTILAVLAAIIWMGIFALGWVAFDPKGGW